MENYREGFGARLKGEREKLGLTQEEFARLGGVQKLAQHRYEKGLTQPSVSYLYAIEPYGVDIGYLLDGRRGGAAPQGSDIDIELMQGIIIELEDCLSKLGVLLSSNKKARIIAMLYRSFCVDGVVLKTTIEEFVNLAIDEAILVRPRLR